MAKSLAQLKHPFAKIVGDFPTEDVFIIAAHIKEGLSKITETRVVFALKHPDMSLEKLLGKRFEIEVKTGEVEDSGSRKFLGTCVEAEYLGLAQGYEMYAIEMRPWLWFLTQSADSRVFQNKTAPEIIKKVFSDRGFSDVSDKLNGSYAPRPYVIQYDETDFDFVQRLMEDEGIYFFFDQSGAVEKLVLADDRGAHAPVPGESELEFKARVMKAKRDQNVIFEFGDRQKVRPGKVSLVDRDFEKLNTKLDLSQIKAKGSHSHKDYEQYRMFGRFSQADHGETQARVAVEAMAHQTERYQAAMNVRTLSAGNTLKMKAHPRDAANGEYLVVDAEHFLQIELDTEKGAEGAAPVQQGQAQGEGGGLEELIINKKIITPGVDDLYVAKVELAKASEPFRAPRTIPWPKMDGVHRAIVCGPSGEEIYTDPYGRIKVQFFWDREGELDENVSCFVRVMQPWAQKGFGTTYIPRIGAEVLIMFERNDPNYPICIGSLYNSFDTIPYAQPDNMTQTVMFKTQSTKNGGADAFHEMVLEDKKDAEFIRIHSERDWFQTVENNAEITVGLEKKDAGDLTLTVQNHMTETLKEGNHTFLVDQGKQTITIEGDQSIEVRSGHHKTKISSGNHDTEVSSGNHGLKISSGNQTTDISAGKQTVTAAQSIELKVGGSSIKIEPAKITIKSAMIAIEADATATMKSTATTVEGSAMTTIKGGMVKIN